MVLAHVDGIGSCEIIGLFVDRIWDLPCSESGGKDSAPTFTLFILNANMVTLEEYLNRQNPDIDNSNTSPGPNTVHAGYSDISGFEDWGEFKYKTLRSLYGDVLDRVLPTVPHDQNPIGLETEIWDKKQLEFVVSQYILYPVRFALRQAYRFCEQSWNHNNPHEFTMPIDPGVGGRAKRPTDSDDPRF